MNLYTMRYTFSIFIMYYCNMNYNVNIIFIFFFQFFLFNKMEWDFLDDFCIA